MTGTWIVHIELAPSGDPETCRTRLRKHVRSELDVRLASDRTLQLRLVRHEQNAGDAVRAAVALVEDDIRRGTLPALLSVTCHRGGGREPIPELVGLSEISVLLAVTRQRVAQLTKHPEFPPPVSRLAMGPVYSARSIRNFQQEWQRQVGRPRQTRYPRNMSSPLPPEWA
jgi:hypothetical protein